MTKSGKHCSKRRNCTFCAISSFVTMFSKSRLLQRRQNASIWGKGLIKVMFVYEWRWVTLAREKRGWKVAPESLLLAMMSNKSSFRLAFLIRIYRLNDINCLSHTQTLFFPWRLCSRRLLKNIVTKGEIAHNEQILFLPQRFQLYWIIIFSFM